MFDDIKNPYIKNTLSALFVALVGFVLLNLTFIVYALIVNGVGLLFPKDFAAKSEWYVPVSMSIISIGFIVGYWFVFRSKLKEIYKATMMTVPSAIILIAVGIVLFQWSLAVYIVSVALIALVLFYFYKTKQPWLYWFAVIVVAIALLIMNLTGTDI